MRFPTTDELRRLIQHELTRSGITDVRTDGSASNIMVGSFITTIARITGLSQSVYVNSTIQNANGVYLDIHGEGMGLKRRGAMPPIAFAEDENVLIRATHGELRSKLGEFIQVNTRITDSTGQRVYLIPETPVPAGVTEMYVTAYAIDTGPTSNVGVGELTVLDVPVSDVEVSNLRAINNGVPAESDDSYRARLLVQQRGGNQMTLASAVQMALSVPGVTYATGIEGAFGINHPAIIVTGPDRVQAGLVETVESNIIPNLPFGTRITVLTPNYRSLSLELVVSVQEGFRTEATRSAIRTAIIQRFFPHIPGMQMDLTMLDPVITREVVGVIDVSAVRAELDGSVVRNVLRVGPRDQVVLDNISVDLV